MKPADADASLASTPASNAIAPDIPSRFEDAVAELETIVAAMESGSLSLEDSLNHFQRGSQLLRHCRNTLESAEQRIKVLEGETLQNFDNSPDKS